MKQFILNSLNSFHGLRGKKMSRGLRGNKMRVVCHVWKVGINVV